MGPLTSPFNGLPAFVSTRGQAPAVSLKEALFEGLAPDGGLYVPARVDPWPAAEVAAIPGRSLHELALQVLTPFTRGLLAPADLCRIVEGALDFPIPLVEVTPGCFALELFHGPTLAFKDVGARVMARLMAALHDGEEVLTVIVATSGDTGGAVASAFHDVPRTRVVILYPKGLVSPTQEAQLVRYNVSSSGATGDVHAYAVAGTFDDCQRLVKQALADGEVRRRIRLTSANSINIGRLLPQMVYYFQAVARLGPGASAASVATPSGNFGNLTAGILARRAGLPMACLIAATNVNDVVPAYLATGQFRPRPSIATLANAMDVGNPNNFDRMLFLYDGAVEAMRREIIGSRHDDREVRAAIRRVFETTGYVLDPHSAIGYLAAAGVGRPPAIFLATAHPAKFAEIVEPVIGRTLPVPEPLADALAQPRHVTPIPDSFEAVTEILLT